MKKTYILKFLLTIMLTLFASINTSSQIEIQTKFSIIPNPSKTNVMTINISTPMTKGYKLEVFNVLGKKMHSQVLSKSTSKIDISEWNSGMFLVKLSSDVKNNNGSLTKRFVKV
ncbi:hypothetical protein A8C32_16785 [Flavivirga aquatica]|uniref:Secretion system C-terminal sorting domain-containing protein n=1 Tax=Flavivirga aquatica TaxID=1849968 RepID=A0A1E5T8J8_9FLAO|nr:T9SS type A sorting domain-containing protein [Flavivirga aquatica]OEK07709.1 hypothetical protein A8C32_16785 [Flavivirga aquatica]